MTVLIETLSGGTVVDTETCNIRFKTAAFLVRTRRLRALDHRRL